MDNVEKTQQELDLEPQVQVAPVDEDAPIKVEKSAASDEITPEEGINHLKRQLEDERRARQEADQRAYQAQLQAQMAQKNAQDGDYNLIVSAIDKSKRDSDILKRGYAEAMAVGDFSKAADFQEAIALNANKLHTLENGKVAMENKLKQPVQQVAPPMVDKVEELASRMTPRSANWLRNHPEFARDEQKRAEMVRAHSHAMGEGHIPDTDAYFHHVEMRLGLHQPSGLNEEEVISVAAAPTQRRTSSPSPAPSTRVASNTSGRPNIVRLTSEQREMASMMGMTPEEYAKNMVSLKREGKIQ